MDPLRTRPKLAASPPQKKAAASAPTVANRAAARTVSAARMLGVNASSHPGVEASVKALKARLLFLMNQELTLQSAYEMEKAGQMQTFPTSGAHIHLALAFAFLRHNPEARIKSMSKDVVGIDTRDIPRWKAKELFEEMSHGTYLATKIPRYKALFLSGPGTLWLLRAAVQARPEQYRDFLWNTGQVPESELAEIMDPWYEQAAHATIAWIKSFDRDTPHEAPWLAQFIADLNPLTSVAKIYSLWKYDKPPYAMPGTKATTLDWVEGWAGLAGGLESIFGGLLADSLKGTKAAKALKIARDVANPLERLVADRIVKTWSKDEVVKKIMASIIANAIDKSIGAGVEHVAGGREEPQANDPRKQYHWKPAAAAVAPMPKAVTTYHVSAGPSPDTKVHSVKSGETLESLADENLGAKARWREIYEENRLTIEGSTSSHRMPSQPPPLRAGMLLVLHKPVDVYRLFPLPGSDKTDVLSVARNTFAGVMRIKGEMLTYVIRHPTTADFRADFEMVLAEQALKSTGPMKGTYPTYPIPPILVSYGGDMWAPDEYFALGTWLLGHCYPKITYQADVDRDGNLVWTAEWLIRDDYDLEGGKDHDPFYRSVVSVAGPLWHDVLGGRRNAPIEARWRDHGKFPARVLEHAVRLTVQTFIPDKYLPGTRQTGYGDNRGFGKPGDHYRTFQQIIVQPDPKLSKQGTFGRVKAATGPSETTFSFVSGQVSAKALHMSAARRDAGSVTVQFGASIQNGAFIVGHLSPAIDFHGAIVIIGNPGGKSQYALYVSHDPFPAYEIFIGDTPIYRWSYPAGSTVAELWGNGTAIRAMRKTGDSPGGVIATRK